MTCTDEVQARGVSFRVQQETFVCGIRFEVYDSVFVIEFGVEDVIFSEGTGEDIQEVAVLTEDDAFGAGVAGAEVEYVAD